jgi:hypothetical protein
VKARQTAKTTPAGQRAPEAGAPLDRGDRCHQQPGGYALASVHRTPMLQALSASASDRLPWRQEVAAAVTLPLYQSVAYSFLYRV